MAGGPATHKVAGPFLFFAQTLHEQNKANDNGDRHGGEQHHVHDRCALMVPPF
jgi:hypothetical protein